MGTPFDEVLLIMAVTLQSDAAGPHFPEEEKGRVAGQSP